MAPLELCSVRTDLSSPRRSSGHPKALTDASGQVVWKASYSPFGKASITTQGPTFNLRFPGQYYDAETGLHYNWRRYDPNTGRYITSDPIGLAGGINTYAYALSNPIGNADPTGSLCRFFWGLCCHRLCLERLGRL